MITLRQKNLLAALCAAVFAIHYFAILRVIFVLHGPESGEWQSDLMLVIAGLSAAISSFIIFPYMGRSEGSEGLARDLVLILLAIVATSAIAGTFYHPSAGYWIGPTAVLMGAMHDIRLAALLVIGMGVALTLTRIRTVDAR